MSNSDHIEMHFADADGVTSVEFTKIKGARIVGVNGRPVEGSVIYFAPSGEVRGEPMLGGPPDDEQQR